jgi:hypothetical protein
MLVSGGPLIGAGLAGCHWWLLLLVAGLTVYLQGAEAAMRWLDVIARVRTDRR